MQRKRVELLRAERAGEQRVVADFGVGIEREVVGGKADVGVEQDLQATLERGVDRLGARAPEQPVMHDQQLGALGGGHFEQLGVRGNAGRDRRHFHRSGNLNAVGAIVLKAPRRQQPLDLREDVGKVGGHQATIAVRRCEILAGASGRGAAW